jgi:hypothetical protein
MRALDLGQPAAMEARSLRSVALTDSDSQQQTDG